MRTIIYGLTGNLLASKSEEPTLGCKLCDDF